jgi:protein disulfide-isomerase
MNCLTAYGQQSKQKQSVREITTKNGNKMKIEIWSDIMCPFCYIGKRNFETALSQFANKEQVEVEWKSFQLDPTIPEVPNYQEDMYMFVADRKGFNYEQSKKMHQDLVQYAKSVGLEYNFDKALVTNSLKGHRLIQFAKTKGLEEKQKSGCSLPISQKAKILVMPPF